MRNWAYIIAFLFLSAEGYANGCANGQCNRSLFARDTSLIDGAGLSGADFANAQNGIKNNQERIDKLNDQNKKHDEQIEKNKADIGNNPEQTQTLTQDNEKRKKEKEKNQKEIDKLNGEINKYRQQQMSSAKDAMSKMAGAEKLKEGGKGSGSGNGGSGNGGSGNGGGGGGGGMPPMMPPQSGGGGDKGGEGGGGGQNDLKAPAVQTPAPLPTPQALSQKSDQILDDRQFQAALAEAQKSQVSDSTRLKSEQAVASLTQQNADLAKQVQETKAAAALARADVALSEMQRAPKPRNSTGTMIASNNNSSKASPFDLSAKSGADSQSVTATKSTSDQSQAAMTAMKVTPKAQASSRLLASATGSTISVDNSEVQVSEGSVVKKALATKPRTVGPVYGMRSRSTKAGTYANVSVPKALQTSMNSRIAIVGGSTPKNRSAQVAAGPAVRPGYLTDGSTAHLRRSQPLGAHVVR